ncbi:spinster family MFS transporter [Sphingopyxis terrae]|uniref:spinster family MFS transporter n=1 Tax=Sphingopyxis terrae TaxID=33052 RepID=UPI002A156A57|nr:MFS transporter [Sphingopyxis terrae]MDX8356438.1 MFS transporter [Sphingopyxis terrae]
MNKFSGPRGERQLWIIVFVLMLVGIMNYVDRMLPSVLAEPIRQEFALSDSALGFINGLGFLVVYSLACIPMARFADNGRQGMVIAASLVTWSVMTMLGAFAGNAVQLAIARVGVALGEAGAIPASHAFITRHLPPARRARALAVFTLCVPLGTMAGHAAGGILGEQLGWRNAFLILGGIGLVLTLIVVRILPLRRTTDDAAAVETGSDEIGAKLGMMHLLRLRSFVAMLGATAFMGAGGYASGAFIPAFLMRSHGFSVGQAGTQYGLAAGVLGVLGLLLTGYLADRLARRDPRWILLVVVVMTAAALPISFLSFSIQSAPLAVLALATNPAIGYFYIAPVVAAAHQIAPPQLRARASALIVLATSLSGGSGALAVGLMSDHLKPAYDIHALGHALILVPLFFTLGLACLIASIVFFRADLAARGTSPE